MCNTALFAHYHEEPRRFYMFSFFEKLIQPFPPEHPGQAPKNLFAFCYHYTKGAEIHLVIMAILTGATAVLEVSLFKFLGTLVDLLPTVQAGELFSGTHQSTLIKGAAILFAIPIVVFFHATIIHQTLLGNFPMRIRWQGHRYLLGQSINFYQNEFAGRIATKLMQTALAVRETVLKLLDVLLYVSVYFTSIVVIVASLDWRLAIPMLLWLILYAGLLRYFLPRLGRVASQQADARSDMTGRIVDTYTNITTVKLFSHDNRESEYAREGMQQFLTTVYPQMRLATLLRVLVWTLNAVLIFVIVTMSLWLWSLNAITTGAIAAAVGLILRVSGMSQWIMWEISSLFENIGIVRDGLNTLSLPQEVKDNSSAHEIKITQGKIQFRETTFHYGKGQGVFEKLNLEIQPGEKIGLVGRSGAGKSTLVNLLLRFYDVEAGEILIDGQNIAEVTQESLRAQIAMVTQDTSLLHRSIRENLLYGKPEASEAAMMEAARQAKAEEFIQELEDVRGRRAYAAHVGERGVKLSGGQRQRIAIARVLLKDAPILILDEATSALDSEVELAIQENLYTLMEGKTVIAIAHRLSTIAALDRLIVLDRGQIVEQGTHKELIRQKGLYAQLWAHQSGGFLGET